MWDSIVRVTALDFVGWVDGWMAMWLARPQGEGEKSYLSVCWEAVSPEMWKCV
jgi:hypothetical protein